MVVVVLAAEMTQNEATGAEWHEALWLKLDGSTKNPFIRRIIKII